jgi:hypothetical protein
VRLADERSTTAGQDASARGLGDGVRVVVGAARSRVRMTPSTSMGVMNESSPPCAHQARRCVRASHSRPSAVVTSSVPANRTTRARNCDEARNAACAPARREVPRFGRRTDGLYARAKDMEAVKILELRPRGLSGYYTAPGPTLVPTRYLSFYEYRGNIRLSATWPEVGIGGLLK